MRKLLLAILLGPTVLAAQSDSTSKPRPTRVLGSVFLRKDSLEVIASSRSIWRTSDLGALPIGGAIHLGLWQIDGIKDRHAVVGAVVANAPLYGRNKPDRVDLTDWNMGYRYKIDTEQGELNVRYHERRFSDIHARTRSSTFDLSLQHRFDVPLTELRPIFGLLVSRGTGSEPSTWLEPKFELDAGLPPSQNGARSMRLRIELRPSFSDLPKTGESARQLRFQGGTLGAWLGADAASSILGPGSFELGSQLWWTRVPDARARGVLSTRLVIK